MKEERQNTMDITSEETKRHSEFLKQIIDFGDYQKKEIGQGSKKGYLIIAVDGDAAVGEGAYSTAVVGGNKEYLNGVIKTFLTEESGVSLVLKRAMTEVAMEHVMGDLLKKLRGEDD